MRRKTSLLAVLAASFVAPLAFAGNVHFADVPLCLRQAETGQVQCSGSLVGLEQVPANVQVIVPYHCPGASTRPVPALIIGDSGPIDGGDVRSFALTTPPVQCDGAQPATLASQIAVQVVQEGAVVMRQNVPLSARPQPQPQPLPQP